MPRVPLSILDLVPIPSGGTASDALRNSAELARAAERAGYTRYWLAEHHLNPGLAGTAPAVLIALLAGETSTIRLGSGAVQMGHRSALPVVEEFGLLATAAPGRIDLGLGRSPGPPPPGAPKPPPVVPGRTPEGLLLPEPFNLARLRDAPRIKATAELLRPDGTPNPDYTRQVEDILALLEGRWKSADGLSVQVVPGERADIEVWVLGSGPGESAEVAGANGLPFAAAYHIAPATVVQAVEAYRAAFRPSAALDRPYVMVSADAVVAEDDAAAHELALGYPAWVRSIRTGQGAIPYPSAAEAAGLGWTDADRELVADRVDTQFVGSPATVAAQLEVLRAATGADELLVTTITHEHAARVRSYQLLAHEWLGAPVRKC